MTDYQPTMGSARPIAAGLVRRWQNAESYRRRAVVPGRWHAYDVDEEAARTADRNMRRLDTPALCGRVDNLAWHHTEPDPLELGGRPKSWRQVCVKCAKAAGRPIPSGIGYRALPTPKESPMPEPTPEPEVAEAQVEVITISDMPRILAERSLYLAIASALLDSEAEAIQFLRGQARIGLLAGPDGPTGDEKDVDLHRMVMGTLERLGVEPISEEELHAEMRVAAQSASIAMAKFGVALGADGRVRQEGPKPN